MERILVGRAADTYVLASSEKLGTVAAFSVAGLSAVAGVITDADRSHPTVAALRNGECRCCTRPDAGHLGCARL
jgi:DeoR/GlpR family transcriptional regulator of sugar metabolism